MSLQEVVLQCGKKHLPIYKIVYDCDLEGKETILVCRECYHLENFSDKKFIISIHDLDGNLVWERKN